MKNPNICNIDLENTSYFQMTADNQPECLLRKNISCCEDYLPFLRVLYSPFIEEKLCNVKKHYLTRQELKKYNELVANSCALYNEKDSDHEDYLKRLYDFLFEYEKEDFSVSILTDDSNNTDDTKKRNDYLISSKWKTIGFQSANPRTDFRAGGISSLRFIVFFVRNFNSEFEQMKVLDCFLFAVVAIKLSVILLTA